MPMMAFMGVRISWLMFARKSAFACGGACGNLLGSAHRLLCRLSLGDVAETDDRTDDRPSFEMGVAVYSTGTVRPSLPPEHFVGHLRGEVFLFEGGAHGAFLCGIGRAVGPGMVDQIVDNSGLAVSGE